MIQTSHADIPISNHCLTDKLAISPNIQEASIKVGMYIAGKRYTLFDLNFVFSTLSRILLYGMKSDEWAPYLWWQYSTAWALLWKRKTNQDESSGEKWNETEYIFEWISPGYETHGRAGVPLGRIDLTTRETSDRRPLGSGPTPTARITGDEIETGDNDERPSGRPAGPAQTNSSTGHLASRSIDKNRKKIYIWRAADAENTSSTSPQLQNRWTSALDRKFPFQLKKNWINAASFFG